MRPELIVILLFYVCLIGIQTHKKDSIVPRFFWGLSGFFWAVIMLLILVNLFFS